MGKVNELRQDMIVSICEDYQANKINDDEFTKRMRPLGFRLHEIDELRQHVRAYEAVEA